MEAIEVIRQMAGRFTDEQIATTLNRLRLRTGLGNTWNESRVHSARHYHMLPPFDPSQSDHRFVTMEEAAQRLGVSSRSVRRMIERKKMPANQVVECAPWQIPVEAGPRAAHASRKQGRQAAGECACSEHISFHAKTHYIMKTSVG